MADGDKQDFVYLYIFPRRWAKNVPNPGQFVVKMETWLRLNSIPYEVIEREDKDGSPTGQIPFMRYNGEMIADSNFMIAHLIASRGLDPTDGLTSEQQGVSRALVTMAECSLYWTVVLYRYVHNPHQFAKVCSIMEETKKKVGTDDFLYVSKRVNERASAFGIGRKTEKEVAQIGKSDITALSQCLGNKQFFFGDTPTLVDCSVFGQLSQIVFVDVMPYPHKEVLSGAGHNLVQFMRRMKDLAWPDWEDIVPTGTFEYNI